MTVRVFFNDNTDMIIGNITDMLFDFKCLEINTSSSIYVFEKDEVSHVGVYEYE